MVPMVPVLPACEPGPTSPQCLPSLSAQPCVHAFVCAHVFLHACVCARCDCPNPAISTWTCPLRPGSVVRLPNQPHTPWGEGHTHRSTGVHTHTHTDTRITHTHTRPGGLSKQLSLTRVPLSDSGPAIHAAGCSGHVTVTCMCGAPQSVRRSQHPLGVPTHCARTLQCGVSQCALSPGSWGPQSPSQSCPAGASVPKGPRGTQRRWFWTRPCLRTGRERVSPHTP